ncbi:uncharacterized protein LOC129169742 isoform X1 [Dunckerocampus dactyliophorus]|uniref:uncharacterized protein LOC129169742 isoform X1 n=1 Tax=Dunckerocampus dactyliophorus TaxID=161453 RepID=UPI0024066539|nr:uncharacterized protein LOC129169742 isoform X1 [Dunckerocampus dactyliophorus]
MLPGITWEQSGALTADARLVCIKLGDGKQGFVGDTSKTDGCGDGSVRRVQSLHRLQNDNNGGQARRSHAARHHEAHRGASALLAASDTGRSGTATAADRGRRRAAEEAGGAGEEGCRTGPTRARDAVALCLWRQEKELAPAARQVPGGSVFLPGHHGGHSGGVPEDGEDHVLPVDVPHGDAAGQPGGLPGLVLRGLVTRHGLWHGHPLVPALHTLLLCVLVPARLRSLQVGDAHPSVLPFVRRSFSFLLLFGHRSDSSFSFFIFFFVYVCQVGVYVVQTVGFTGWGACGWISALVVLNTNVAIGALMILIAALFTSLVVMSLIMFKKVHAMYRTTGASFQKAQQEFATEVMSNKTVQTAAASATSRAAQGAFREQI